MTLARSVRVGEGRAGPGEPPLLLADIGTFFNQDIDAGIALIDAVAVAGLGLLKGEVLHDSSICLDGELREIVSTREAEFSTERYRAVVERKVLPLPAYARLFGHARSRGMALALSIYDEAGLRFALEQGAALLKIASSNIVHQPLIARAAASGTPVLMDTGRATRREIERAVGWFTRAGGTELILEYSPPAPPAAVALHALEGIAVLRCTFGCPTGLSDHHHGDEMLYAAIALGANVVEKGVCLDGVAFDQDVAHALPASLLAAVRRKCENVFVALNGGAQPFEDPRGGHPARMGVIAGRDIPALHRIAEGDLAFAFPAVGIPVEDTARVVGSTARSTIAKGTPLSWDDLVPSAP